MRQTMAIKPQVKIKACPICCKQFESWSSLQRVCFTVSCAIEWNKRKDYDAAQKRLKAKDNKWKRDNKPRQKWLKEAQVAFNAYIRARDKGKPCISCGVHEQERFTGGHFDCGHYRSTGAAPHLRFNTDNAAGQCKRCNRDLSGNTVAMRLGMLARNREDRVLRIERDTTIRSYDIEYLTRIKRIFSRRAKKLG